MNGISIHSPLAGRDIQFSVPFRHRYHFNPLAPRGARPLLMRDLERQESISIHSPLAGRDTRAPILTPEELEFQSTRPSRGETKESSDYSVRGTFQSTRPSRGETKKTVAKKGPEWISIHSPLAGRDLTDTARHCI